MPSLGLLCGDGAIHITGARLVLVHIICGVVAQLQKRKNFLDRRPIGYCGYIFSLKVIAHVLFYRIKHYGGAKKKRYISLQ